MTSADRLDQILAERERDLAEHERAASRLRDQITELRAMVQILRHPRSTAR